MNTHEETTSQPANRTKNAGSSLANCALVFFRYVKFLYTILGLLNKYTICLKKMIIYYFYTMFVNKTTTYVSLKYVKHTKMQIQNPFVDNGKDGVST